jgi:hypothetical protein
MFDWHAAHMSHEVARSFAASVDTVLTSGTIKTFSGATESDRRLGNLIQRS